jgi:hypothetical protein
MISNNKKYILIIILGLYILSIGIHRFHFIPLENSMYSTSYTLGYNVGLIFRVLLGFGLITKGILFFKENTIR